MSKQKRVWLPDRPGYGNPSEWMSPKRTVRSEKGHNRVEAIEKESGLYVRCHDCGTMARHQRRNAMFADNGKTVSVVPVNDPLPYALKALDHTPCEPLGQLVLAGAGGRK